MICAVLVIAVVMALIVTAPVGRGVMLAVALTALVRASLLFRSIRRDSQA